MESVSDETLIIIYFKLKTHESFHTKLKEILKNDLEYFMIHYDVIRLDLIILKIFFFCLVHYEKYR